MVDWSGKLWVTDFGLARLDTNDSITAVGELLGTLAYMSPERVHSRKKDTENKRFTGLGGQSRRVFIFGAHVFRFPAPTVIGFSATELR